MEFIADYAEEVEYEREQINLNEPAQEAEEELPWIRPSDKKNKQMCQIVAAALPQIMLSGSWEHVLVTVIPNPETPLRESWEAARPELEYLRDLLRTLPGLICAVLKIETHGCSRPKKKTDDKGKKRKADEEAEAAAEDEQEPAEETPAEAEEKPKSKLAGKPHYHMLLYYCKQHIPPLDLSYCKRKIQAEWRSSDVNERKLPEGKNTDPHVVRAFTYLLKGIGCKATAQYWKHYVSSETSPPLPEFINGPGYVRQDNATDRFNYLLQRLPEYITDCNVPLVGEAAPVLVVPKKTDKATLAMETLAAYMEQLQLFVLPESDHDSFYTYQTIGETVFLHTYVRVHSFQSLVRALSVTAQITDICVRYYDRIKKWFNFSMFPAVPEHDWNYVELLDGIYDIRTGAALPKASFKGACFRAYVLHMSALYTRQPVEWLRLVDHICKPITMQINGATVTHNSTINKEELLHCFTTLLRARPAKQHIPFIYGDSDCGKSSVMMWVTDLWPPEAVAFLNKSVASLSGVRGKKAVLVVDEFRTNMIEREDLLTLTDGSVGLTVRGMHRDAEFIKYPGMPMIFNASILPVYKEDKTDSLKNRFTFFFCQNRIRRDPRAAATMKAETIFIVAYLNRRRNETDLLEEQMETAGYYN